jgi:hypothetical protein
VRTADNPSVGVRTLSTSSSTTARAPAADRQCNAGVRTVPAADVPTDVRQWAGGRPVIGGGELWTVRSAIMAVRDRQVDGVWRLKFPWLTRPFGLPRIDGRRLDGHGTFRADANEAIDQRGKWVVSSLEFLTPGCWEVTARFDRAAITFRLLVGNPPRPLDIGTIAATLREIGGPSPGLDRGVRGTIRVKGVDGTWVRATDAGGRISIDVPAATYTVTGASPQYLDGGYDCGSDPITAVRGRTTNVVVVCPIR